MTRKILWISAILAAIALVPGSVVLGLFLGVLPGLILAAAPTVFLYAVAFEILRIVLRAITLVNESVSFGWQATAHRRRRHAIVSGGWQSSAKQS